MEGIFQPMHLIIILVIVLIIFGPGRLPQIGEGLGKSIRGFKKAMSEKDDPKEEAKSETKAIEQKDEKKS